MLNRADLKKLNDYFNQYDALVVRVAAQDAAIAALIERVTVLGERVEAAKERKAK